MKGSIGTKGFTLAEIVVVITILGILSSMVMLNLQPVVQDSMVTRIKSDLLVLQSAGNMYLQDVGQCTDEDEQVIKQDVLVGNYLSQRISSPIEGYEYRLLVIKAEHRLRVKVTLVNNEGIWQDPTSDFIADSTQIKR